MPRRGTRNGPWGVDDKAKREDDGGNGYASPVSPALQANSLPSEPSGKPQMSLTIMTFTQLSELLLSLAVS